MALNRFSTSCPRALIVELLELSLLVELVLVVLGVA
jgi:hypothetical protein